MFELHPQLRRDCTEAGSFPLCRLLLLNDSNYPWFILVPQRENIREIHELMEEDQQELMREVTLLSSFVQRHFKADKINVAALGNMVPQLHIHVIARYETDPAWPGPVWGKVPAVVYDDDSKAKILKAVRDFLNADQ